MTRVAVRRSALRAASLKNGLAHLIEVAVDDARRAAQAAQRIVFCPPIAVFSSATSATEKDLIAGLALSVECDERPTEALAALTALLGPPTVVVRSGGVWIDPDGMSHDKEHSHWRLTAPAQGADLPVLKTLRAFAAKIVGGDPSNKPIVHPIRWPGSWHRKGEPRLCEIVTLNPDAEIDLHNAYEILSAEAAKLGVGSKPNGAGGATDFGQLGGGFVDWAEAFGKILSGEVLSPNSGPASGKLCGALRSTVDCL